MTNIAVIGDEKSGRSSLASKLGKKGTDSDITLYNDDRHERKYVFIDSKSYPKSLKSLTAALNLADMVVLCVTPQGLTAHTGECIIAADLLGFRHGIIAITMADTSYGAVIDDLKAKLKKITAGTTLENWDIIALNTNKDAPNAFEGVDTLKDRIHELADQIEPDLRAKDDLPPRVVIDHFFNVTGIGIVILGRVLQGTIHTHDKIGLYPVDKKVDIRSIQTHDIDVKAASTGARVGVGLKGLLERELERGFLLSDSEKMSSEFDIRCRVSAFAKNGIKKDDSLNMFVGLQSDSVRVNKITVNGSEVEKAGPGQECIVTVEAGKKIAYSPDDLFLLAHLSETQRFVAAGKSD